MNENGATGEADDLTKDQNHFVSEAVGLYSFYVHLLHTLVIMQTALSTVHQLPLI